MIGKMISKIIDSVSFKSFLTGVSLFMLLFITGDIISKNVSTVRVSSFWKILLSTIFVGASLGHYLGKAVRKKGEIINSFLIGAYGSLFTVLFFNFNFQRMNLVLLLSLITFFGFHISNLVKDNGFLRIVFIRIFSEILSLIFLVSIAIFHYIIPLIRAI